MNFYQCRVLSIREPIITRTQSEITKEVFFVMAEDYATAKGKLQQFIAGRYDLKIGSEATAVGLPVESNTKIDGIFIG